MKNLENVKELNELEVKEVVGGLHSPFTLGPDNPFPFDKPNDDPNIKLDNIGGPGPGGVTYTW